MSRLDKPAWLLYLLVAVPSSVLSCLVTIWVIHSSPVPEPVLTTSDGDLDRVLQEIRELRTRLGDGIRAEPGRFADAVAQARQPLPNPEVEHLANIVERLERLLHLGQLPNRVESLATQRDSPINWSAFSALSELHRQDDRGTTRSVRLLTVKEVITRFGFPSLVQGGNIGMIFWYHVRDLNGKRQVHARFEFVDGYVVRHFIDGKDR